MAEGKAISWDGNLLLTMAPDSVGTVVSSTHYLWYGKVSATLKTSRGKGVVSAFILFSPVKDEIDYEWVGVNLHNVQSNYYFQGIPVCKLQPDNLPNNFIFPYLVSNLFSQL